MKKLLLSLLTLLFCSSLTLVHATDYYVAGSMNGWNTTSNDNKMSLVSGNIYSKTFAAMGAASYEFKISTYNWGSSWGSGNIDNSQSNVTLGGSGNITFTLSTTSDVTFYFNAGTSIIYVQATAVVVPTYTFTSGTTIYYDFTGYGAGVNLFNSVWSNEWKDNVSSIISCTLTSSWEVTASSSLFKSDASSWSIVTCSTLPTEGQNMLVSTDGKTYHWDTYSGDAPDPTPHTYTVAGNSAALFGETWSPSNTDNDMEEQQDGTFLFERTGITLSNGAVEFKVCQDYSWSPSYPAQNYQLAIASEGIYTISITFNPSTSGITATATKTGEAVVVPVITLHSNITNSEWETSEEFDIADGNATATLTLTIDAGNYEFGVKKDGTWTSNGSTFTRANNAAVITAGSGNNTFKADVDGDYTFTWTYETNTLTITYPDATIETYHLYVRNLTEWETFDVYAYGSEEYFGTWPGRTAANNTTTVDGVTYKVYDFEAIEGASFEMNLIFHNNVGEGQEGDYRQTLALTEARNYYLTVSKIAAWEGKSGVKRFRACLPLEHVYGYQFDSEGPTGTEWPGDELIPDGEGWYEYVINKGRTVIFNTGAGADAMQTGDLAYTDADPVADECAVWQGETNVYDTKTYMLTVDDCDAVCTLTYERDVTPGRYGTICLPFEAESVSGATLFSIAGKSGDGWGEGLFIDEETTLLKGVPYFFLATADKLIVRYWEGQSFSPSNDNLYTSNGLVGFIGSAPSDEYTVTANAHNYILYNNGLYFVNSVAKIISNRAFVDWSNVPQAAAPAPGRQRRSISVNRTPTIVEEIVDMQSATKIIRDGALFIQRDGKVYTIIGQPVK